MLKNALCLLLSIFLFTYGLSQNYRVYEKKGKYGVKNLKGEFILPVKYVKIYDCKNSVDHLIAESKKGYILFNVKTKKILKLDDNEYDLKLGDICQLSENDVIRFHEKEKTGLMCFPDKVILPADYSSIYLLNSFPGKFLLNNEELYCIYDFKSKKESKWFELPNSDYGIVLDYDRSYITEEEVFIAKIDDKLHVGKIIGDFIALEKISDIEYDPQRIYLLTKKDGKYGFVDYKGNVMIPFIYEDAEWFYLDFGIVKYKGKYGVISNSNEVLIPFIYDNLKNTGHIYNFYCIATIGNKSVKIDRTGEPVISLSPCEENGKWGYKDEEGNVFIDYVFDYAHFFNGIYAIVNKGGKYDIEKEKVIGGKWGYIAATGDIIIECIYDEAFEFEHGKAKVTKGGNTYYIDYYGNRVEK